MKKISMQRLLTAVLALILVLSVVSMVGCAETTDQNKPTATPTGSQPTATPTEDPDEEIVYAADIPDGINYNDETFTVYAYPSECFVWYDYDWQHEDGPTGDRISDAVLARTQRVEEDLNIKIVNFNGKEYSNPTEFITSVSSGDDTYQVGNITMLNHIKMIQNGYLQEISSYSDELQLDAPWWDQNLQEDMAISDNFFCLLGDIGTMYKRCIACIIFNKDLMTKNSMAFPYDMSQNKTWTIEAMLDMASNVHADIDGDQQYTDADLYGLICFDDVLPAMMIGANVQYATKNDDGIPELSMYDDHTIDILDYVSTYLYDDEITYNVTAHNTDENTMWKMFMGEQALFYYGELHSAEDMRKMEGDFGILPMPLYDEEQENYRHTVNPNVAAVYVIPMTNVDDTRTAYVLDSLGAASKNILTPAYYDINLQGIVSRDNDSATSLDTIISTMSYDMGYLYISEAGALFRDLMHNKSTDFASKYDTKSESMAKTLELIMDAINDNY